MVGPTNHGIIKSIYFFDPNGHRLELTCRVGTPEQMKELDTLKWTMLEEWSKSKKVGDTRPLGCTKINYKLAISAKVFFQNLPMRGREKTMKFLLLVLLIANVSCGNSEKKDDSRDADDAPTTASDDDGVTDSDDTGTDADTQTPDLNSETINLIVGKRRLL